jgi:hypothetical protein
MAAGVGVSIENYEIVLAAQKHSVIRVFCGISLRLTKDAFAVVFV